MSLLEVRNVQKIYTTRFGGSTVEALHDVNFTVEEGEYVAIMGESGSGKTTLLNILAALDKPTQGTVLLDGRDFAAQKEQTLSAFRRDQLGFVFQEFNLLDTFNIGDNICLPLLLAGLHLTFAFPLVWRILQLFELSNLKLLIFVTIGAYLVFALLYTLVYRLASNAYYNIVSGAKGA